MSGTPIESPADEDFPIDAMHHIRGTDESTNRNKCEFFAATGEKNAAMNYVATGATAKQTNENSVSMMVVGYEGDEVQKIAKEFTEIAGDRIKIKIKVEGEENPYEAKLAPTLTVDEVVMKMKKQYQSFFNILRNGEKLDGDMTLGQAAHTGSTVNWIAKRLT